MSEEEIRKQLEKLKDKEQELTDEQGYWGGTALQEKIELLEKQLCKIHEIEKELEYEKQKNFRRSDMIFDLLKENKSITKNFISKDKIKKKIEKLEKSKELDENRRKLPFDLVQEQNKNIDYKIEVLQELLEE